MSSTDHLRVGALAHFIQILTKRLGNEYELRSKAKKARLKWRTLQRIASGEVRLPKDTTLERIAIVLAEDNNEKDKILTEARKMRDQSNRK